MSPGYIIFSNFSISVLSKPLVILYKRIKSFFCLSIACSTLCMRPHSTTSLSW